jgi:Pvc16 N-terminal domain
MTAHFAIPATTFVLQAIIQKRVAAAYGSFTGPTVSIEPPPRPPAAPPAPQPGQPTQGEPAGLHLFLHHAGPNPAWRNMHEPHVSPLTGRRTGKAPVVLDLHYMLAATGASLEREALLGIGISTLTRNALVPRAMVQSILAAIAIPNPAQSFMDRLTAEPLHDPAHQPEQISISQAAVDLDMSTKLWSALQSPLRPSAFFLVTTAFLDVAETFPAVLPVAKVGVAAHPTPDRDTVLPPLGAGGGP